MSYTRYITIPLSNDGKTVRCMTIDGDLPMTQAEWDRMLEILEAIRPGLIGEASEPEPVVVTEAEARS
jgi:hypothetical protein